MGLRALIEVRDDNSQWNIYYHGDEAHPDKLGKAIADAVDLAPFFDPNNHNSFSCPGRGALKNYSNVSLEADRFITFLISHLATRGCKSMYLTNRTIQKEENNPTGTDIDYFYPVSFVNGSISFSGRDKSGKAVIINN